MFRVIDPRLRRVNSEVGLKRVRRKPRLKNSEYFLPTQFGEPFTRVALMSNSKMLLQMFRQFFGWWC